MVKLSPTGTRFETIPFPNIPTLIEVGMFKSHLTNLENSAAIRLLDFSVSQMLFD
jgi:hypothetical protein